MNEKVLELARELLITSEYLFDKAVEMAEEELGIGLYDEWYERSTVVYTNSWVHDVMDGYGDDVWISVPTVK